MGKLIGIDYGRRRVGVAVSDELQIIASPLCTLSPEETLVFLKEYCAESPVDTIVVGQPRHTYSAEAPVEIEADILAFVAQLGAALPGIPVERYDERFTSKIAARDMFTSGAPKGKRQEKGALDRTSAAIILRDYMESRGRR